MTSTQRSHTATTARPGLSLRHGFSLVELLVAVTLALVVLLGVVQVFSSSSATARLNDAQTRVQETGRYATQVLAQELRMARNTGCSSLALDDYRDSLNVVAKSLRNGITEVPGRPPVGAVGPTRALGYSATATTFADLPTDARTALSDYRLTTKSGTTATPRGDVFVYWGIVGDGAYVDVTSDSARTGLIKLIAKSDILTAGQLALITDCEGTDIFTATGVPAGTVTADGITQFGHSAEANTSASLSRAYNWTGSSTMPGPTVRARVFPFDLRVYFIGCVDQQTGGLKKSTDGNSPCGSDSSTRYRPALCRWSAAKAAVTATAATDALLLDIADMRVTYNGFIDAGKEEGAKAAGKTRFRDLATVTNASWVDSKNYWNRVDTLHIELLATSSDEVAVVRQKQYTASIDQTVLGYGLPADRRVYEAYRFTIATRANSSWFGTSN